MVKSRDIYNDEDLQKLYNKKYFLTRSRPLMWKRRAEFIAEKFNPKTALDVGCSMGELTKSLDELGIESYGIDGSEYALSQADKSIKEKLFKVNFNSDKFPFDNKKFDFIGGFYSVEHIHNIEFFSNELRRVLKDDGIIWFLTPNVGIEGRNSVDVFTNTVDEWKKIFNKFGFDFKKFSPHEMMVLKGKLRKFHFYNLPNPIQNVIKKIAYSYSNKGNEIMMKDTSFILTKNTHD